MENMASDRQFDKIKSNLCEVMKIVLVECHSKFCLQP